MIHGDDGRLGAKHTGFVNGVPFRGRGGENSTGNGNGCIIIIDSDYYPTLDP